jgi:hypothetical protein
MQDTKPQAKPTIHQATYRVLLNLAKQMGPVSKLAAEAESPEQPHPMDTVIELLRQLVGGIDRVHVRLENLEARLDEPAVVKTIKSAIHG